MNTKSHQTGEPRGPLPSGGKTPANLLSLEYPRALRARCGVQGHCPCQTGEPWHLSCHGGKTPAKSHVPPTPLRA